MNNTTFRKLQIDDVKKQIVEYCTSTLGKNLIEKLMPSNNINIVKRRLSENKEARKIIDNCNHIPLEGLSNVNIVMGDIDKGMTADPVQLIKMQDFLRGCRKVKGFMETQEFYAPTLSSYALNITPCRYIEEEIERCIVRNKVDSKASPELKKVRRNIDVTEDKIKERLNKFLTSSSNKNYIRDFVVTKREDRFVIPIKASYKNDVEGVILDSSAKGSTVFIEPKSISRLSADLIKCKSDEAIEEYKILCMLSDIINENILDIKLNADIMAEYDMVFAKAKYSMNIKGITPKVNSRGYIKIVKGRHPLLAGEVVPLNVEIGKGYRSLLITGPNAGGKTVALKTVGILTLMVQCGFDICADKDTEMGIFENVFVDIGDDQSIENALSTFSSHIKNISDILRCATKSTLVICDEIGSGTEPNEGAALAIAILEELYRKGCTTMASTHYSELKKFAKLHPDFENAGMLFDKETLNPKYKLVIGTSQDSNALYISKKMGIADRILDNAKGYLGDKSYNLEVVKIKPQIVETKREVEPKDINSEYFKGDRVYLTEKDDYGLIYEPINKFHNVVVLYEGEFIKVNVRKVRLYLRASELYPDNYDLDTLFTSYEDRKLAKDINRGSKKVIKEIHKDIKTRKLDRDSN